jgi:hypothetical protein
MEAITCAKTERHHDGHKQHDGEETNFLSHAENRPAGSDIPEEPAFVQVGVRKHNVSLAVDYVALPILHAHGAEMIQQLVL